MLSQGQRSHGCPWSPLRYVLREETALEPSSQQALASPGKPQPREHKRRTDFFVASVAALASAAVAASQRSGHWRPQRGEMDVVSMRDEFKVNRSGKKIHKTWLES